MKVDRDGLWEIHRVLIKAHDILTSIRYVKDGVHRDRQLDIEVELERASERLAAWLHYDEERSDLIKLNEELFHDDR